MITSISRDSGLWLSQSQTPIMTLPKGPRAEKVVPALLQLLKREVVAAVGRCRLTLSKPVLKAPMASEYSLEATM